MSTTATKPTSTTVGGSRWEEGLAPFWSGNDGHWRLLNLTPEDWGELEALVREHGCHEEQLPALQGLLQALRELYQIAATGDLELTAGGSKKGAEVAARVERANSTVRAITGRFFIAWVPGYIAQDGRYHCVLQPVPGWNLRDRAVLSPSLFAALGAPLGKLLDGLASASRSTVFVCEWCEKIGPAMRRRKQFCNSRCRRSFNYRRTGI